MFEKLMENLRPNELEKIRAILVEAFNERVNEFQQEPDHELCGPMYYFSKAIDVINSSM